MREEVEAIVDIREPTGVIEAVKQHPDVVDFSVDKLEAGDIVIRGVGFERKTMADYSSSLIGKEERTLADQREKMKDAFEHPYILIDGDMSDASNLSHTKIKPESIRGSIASMEARHDVSVIPCSNTETLVDTAVRIARKTYEEPVSNPIPSGSVTGNDVHVTKRIYSCLDGVGAETAERLYTAFPAIEEILNADKATIMDIEGIGESRAERIQKQLKGKEIIHDR